jgi:maleylpyruvate isomerase
MTHDLKLYSYFRSSASYRVRIALNLKGLKYEYVPVHLINQGGEQLLEPYKKLNPSAELPTLVHKAKALSQSVAIIHYLDDVYPEKPLFPADPYLKAKIMQVCEVVNSGIQPLQNLRVLKKLTDDFQVSEEQKNIWIQHWIRLGFEGLETMVKEFAGDFSFGNKPTAADAFVVPQVYNAHRFKLSMDKFPTLSRIANHCNQLEAFKSAHPDTQPDTPLV